jgi:hypothetical protein
MTGNLSISVYTSCLLMMKYSGLSSFPRDSPCLEIVVFRTIHCAFDLSSEAQKLVLL